MLPALFGLCALAAAEPADDLYARIRDWAPLRQARGVPNIPLERYREALKTGETVSGLEIVEGVAAGKAWGLRVFELPIAQMWKAIADEPNHAGWLAEESVVVQGPARADNHILYLYLDLPIISDRWALTQIRYNRELYERSGGAAWELTWTNRTDDVALRESLDPELFDDGVPVASTTGAWLFVALDADTTFAQYFNWTDPGGLIPAREASSFAARQVDRTLRTLERFAREVIPTSTARFQGPGGAI